MQRRERIGLKSDASIAALTSTQKVNPPTARSIRRIAAAKGQRRLDAGMGGNPECDSKEVSYFVALLPHPRVRQLPDKAEPYRLQTPTERSGLPVVSHF